MEFRLAGDIKDFHGLLDNIKKNKLALLLWQNNEEQIRYKIQVSIKSFIFNKQGISITLNVPPREFSLMNKENPIFLFSEESGVLFKGSYDNWINGLLKITPDPKVLVRENRSFERSIFQYVKITTTLTKEDGEVLGHFKLKDISASGFSVVILSDYTEKIKTGRNYFLASLSDIDTDFLPPCRLVHKTSGKKLKNLKANQTLLGFMFNQPSDVLIKLIEQFNLQKGAW